MKKLLSIAAALVLGASPMYADGDFALKSGSPEAVCQKGIQMNVEFDYSDCTIYDKDEEKYFTVEDYMEFKGEEWKRDLPGELKKAEDAFSEEFNSDAKRCTINPIAKNAEFTVIFHLKEFCYGKKVVWVSSQNAWGSGEVSIKNNTTGEVIVTYTFSKVDGSVPMGTGMMELRRESCYEHVAEALVKRINKFKVK